MKRQIEIFKAGCPVCEPIVQIVKDTAGITYDITFHNLSESCDGDICKKYNVKRIPAVALDGKLLDRCTNIEITKDDLTNAGIVSC